MRTHGRLRRLYRLKDAAVTDFNREGIALCTEHRFRIGEKIELQLDGLSEHIRGIKGVVKYARFEKGEYNLGVQFDAVQINTARRGRKLIGSFEDKRARSNILDRLEDVLLQQLA